MPYIAFEGPKMTKEQKTQLVKEFTELASRTLNLPREAFTIILKENDTDNVGVGGELLSEKLKKK